MVGWVDKGEEEVRCYIQHVVDFLCQIKSWALLVLLVPNVDENSFRVAIINIAIRLGR